MPKNDSNIAIKPINEAFTFSTFPFYWTARVSNLYTQEMEKRLKKKGMTINGWRVAMILRETGPLSVSEIANHAGSRMPTITKTIYKMRDMNMITIAVKENDARVSIAEITEHGISVINDVLSQTSNLFDIAFSNLSEKEIKTTVACLSKIYENLAR